MALKSINVAVLFVSDLGRSKTFYRDVLGMPVKFDGDDSVVFDFDTFMLILGDRESAKDLLTEDVVGNMRGGTAPCQLVSFVEDVDVEYARLKAQGVEFIREPVDREWGLRTAHFRDPDG